MSVSEHVVDQDEDGIRLDRWVRRRFPQVSQGAVQKWCRTGQVRVNGGRVEAAARLHGGGIVRLPPIPAAATPVMRPTPAMTDAERAAIQAMVLYRDRHVIVVNKPPGLATQGGPGIVRHLDGLLDGLRETPDAPRPRLVHRLDRDTSGVLLLACTPGAAAKLAASFRGRAVQKTYWAIVAGRPAPTEGEIDLPLRRVGGARGERTAPAERNDPEAVKAITAYRTLDHAARKVSWLELEPLTGRTHQLRVHCATLGVPILGDGKYGGEAAAITGLSGRLHLHARALRLPHPAGGMLEVAADLPPHMRETFAMLNFDAKPPPPATVRPGTGQGASSRAAHKR